MQSVIGLEAIGTQTINKKRVSVYRLPSGGNYVQQEDENGQVFMLSVEGALALKNGQYPLHRTITIRTSNDSVPISLQSDDMQSERAKTTLRNLMNRLIEVKAPFNTASVN